jgi:hypothetical protein
MFDFHIDKIFNNVHYRAKVVEAIIAGMTVVCFLVKPPYIQSIRSSLYTHMQ